MANGCATADLNFTNFGDTAFGSGPTIGQVDLTGTGSLVSLISLAFTAPTSSASGCGAGTTLWCINSAGENANTFGYIATVNQSQASPPAGDHYAITSLTLSVGAANDTSRDNDMQITEDYCVGVSSAAACSSANEGGLVFFLAVSGAGVGTTTLEACNPGETVCVNNSLTENFSGQGFTQIFIMPEITLSYTGGTGSISLGTFTNSFGETLESPEPSTFFLLAASLGTTAWFRRRKRGRKTNSSLRISQKGKL
jgi:hypothetical protein